MHLVDLRILLVPALVSLSACPGSGDSTGTLTASWSLKNVDGSPASCASGFGTIKVSANYWNANVDGVEPGGTPTVGLFDCAAGSGTLELQTSGVIDTSTLNGKYDVTWEETDSTGGTTVATDLQTQVGQATTVDLSGGSASAATTLYQDGGYAWVEWLLFGMTANNYLDSCAGAGVDKIDLALTDLASTVVTHLSFPCDTSDGTATGAVGVVIDDQSVIGAGIAPIKAGSYGLVATAFAGTQVVGMNDPGEQVTIEDNNKISILATETTITLTTR